MDTAVTLHQSGWAVARPRERECADGGGCDDDALHQTRYHPLSRLVVAAMPVAASRAGVRRTLTFSKPAPLKQNVSHRNLVVTAAAAAINLQPHNDIKQTAHHKSHVTPARF
jgi:hypothetical protein